jgi:soluble lytic murein transglycosylase
MRGRGSLQTRALVIWAGMLCAVLAALGNYSVAQAQSAGETDNQTALAVPRIGLRGAAGVGLPQPLSPSQAALIRRIFSLQDAGAVADAARETARLDSDLLLGTILADRYLHSPYRPTPPELTAWLAHFGDQPEAPFIRDLLERIAPELSVPGAGTGHATDRAVPPAKGKARPSQVQSLFVANRDADAVAAAGPLLAGAPPESITAEALFAAGLAAWRLNQSDTAYAFFEAAWHAASPASLRAASAFWAGHVEQRLQDRGGFAVWMQRAALERDTFYGHVARRALGPSIACLPGETIGDADVDALLATPQGRRAFALVQVGEKRYAEAELRTLWTDTTQDGSFDHALILVTRALGFSQLASEIEQVGESMAQRSAEAELPRLRPAGGFVVDPPLVYALVRHESNFRSVAESRSGATGLMQLMPRTAHAVAGAQSAQLHDPAVNLAIGQRYLLVLADDDAIDGNLLRMLAAYGQGQGALRKWVDGVRDDGDPLLFLEAIPNARIRAFIEDSLVYYWHYAAMMHLPAASLDALAAGRFPMLVRADQQPQQADGGQAGACIRPAAVRGG